MRMAVRIGMCVEIEYKVDDSLFVYLTHEQRGITRDNALRAGMGRALDASPFRPLKEISPRRVSCKIYAVNRVSLLSVLLSHVSRTYENVF
jgi:hypothetical protein